MGKVRWDINNKGVINHSSWVKLRTGLRLKMEGGIDVFYIGNSSFEDILDLEEMCQILTEVRISSVVLYQISHWSSSHLNMLQQYLSHFPALRAFDCCDNLFPAEEMENFLYALTSTPIRTLKINGTYLSTANSILFLKLLMVNGLRELTMKCCIGNFESLCLWIINNTHWLRLRRLEGPNELTNLMPALNRDHNSIKDTKDTALLKQANLRDSDCEIEISDDDSTFDRVRLTPEIRASDVSKYWTASMGLQFAQYEILDAHLRNALNQGVPAYVKIWKGEMAKEGEFYLAELVERRADLCFVRHISSFAQIKRQDPQASASAAMISRNDWQLNSLSLTEVLQGKADEVSGSNETIPSAPIAQVELESGRGRGSSRQATAATHSKSLLPPHDDIVHVSRIDPWVSISAEDANQCSDIPILEGEWVEVSTAKGLLIGVVTKKTEGGRDTLYNVLSPFAVPNGRELRDVASCNIQRSLFILPSNALKNNLSPSTRFNWSSYHSQLGSTRWVNNRINFSRSIKKETFSIDHQQTGAEISLPPIGSADIDIDAGVRPLATVSSSSKSEDEFTASKSEDATGTYDGAKSEVGSTGYDENKEKSDKEINLITYFSFSPVTVAQLKAQGSDGKTTPAVIKDAIWEETGLPFSQYISCMKHPREFGALFATEWKPLPPKHALPRRDWDSDMEKSNRCANLLSSSTFNNATTMETIAVSESNDQVETPSEAVPVAPVVASNSHHKHVSIMHDIAVHQQHSHIHPHPQTSASSSIDQGLSVIKKDSVLVKEESPSMVNKRGPKPKGKRTRRNLGKDILVVPDENGKKISISKVNNPLLRSLQYLWGTYSGWPCHLLNEAKGILLMHQERINKGEFDNVPGRLRVKTARFNVESKPCNNSEHFSNIAKKLLPNSTQEEVHIFDNNNNLNGERESKMRKKNKDVLPLTGRPLTTYLSRLQGKERERLSSLHLNSFFFNQNMINEREKERVHNFLMHAPVLSNQFLKWRPSKIGNHSFSAPVPERFLPSMAVYNSPSHIPDEEWQLMSLVMGVLAERGIDCLVSRRTGLSFDLHDFNSASPGEFMSGNTGHALESLRRFLDGRWSQEARESAYRMLPVDGEDDQYMESGYIRQPVIETNAEESVNEEPQINETTKARKNYNSGIKDENNYKWYPSQENVISQEEVQVKMNTEDLPVEKMLVEESYKPEENNRENVACNTINESHVGGETEGERKKKRVNSEDQASDGTDSKPSTEKGSQKSNQRVSQRVSQRISERAEKNRYEKSERRDIGKSEARERVHNNLERTPGEERDLGVIEASLGKRGQKLVEFYYDSAQQDMDDDDVIIIDEPIMKRSRKSQMK